MTFLKGEEHPALIPFRYANEALEYWSPPMLAKLKDRLISSSGVRFQIRTSRAAFGPRALDYDARMESVSQAPGRRSTKTTEMYEARIHPDKALARNRTGTLD